MLIGLIVACCGQAFADDKVTYSSDVHPTQIYSLKSFYDIDGDGILEVVGSNYNTNSFVSKVNGTKCKALSGIFNLFEYLNDNVGPLLLNKYGTNLWSYKDNQNYNVSDNQPITKFSVENNGFTSIFQDIPSTRTTNDSTIVIWKEQKDGTFKEEKIRYTEYVSAIVINALRNYTPSSGGGSIIGDMFVKSKENGFSDWGKEENTSEAKSSTSTYSLSEFASVNQVEDLNGDGLIDFTINNYIYYNLGNGTYFKSPHKGKIYAADLNNDGLLDYIDFAKGNVDLYMMQANGKMSEKRTIFSNSAMTNIFFGDFDRDGDVDFLLYIPGTTTYTIFFRNDGNGVFKKKETYLEGMYTCFDCKDYDADGLYEILVSNTEASKDYLLKCNKNFTTDLIELPEDENKILADFNHDGITEINSGASYTPLASAKKNTRPEKMGKPIAVLQPDDGKLKITWKQGKDAQTSSCDLTYELRIGTAPGKGDVLFCHALADGTRRNLMDGSMGRSLKYLFDASFLTEGKYYIAVQAVDAGNMGGEWSDEFVYEHKVTVPAISVSPIIFSTANPVDIQVANNIDAATYMWEVDGGKVVKKTSNAGLIQVFYTNSGTKRIEVTMLYNGKKYKSTPININVSPICADGQFSYSNDIFNNGFDMNQDGNIELRKTGECFKRLSINGEYVDVKKSWNSDFTYYWDAPLYFDQNMDGYPDFYMSGLSKGNTFVNSGEQDYDFDYFNTKLGFDLSKVDKTTINNDGTFHFFKVKSGYYFDETTNGFFNFNSEGNFDIVDYENSINLNGEKYKFFSGTQLDGFADFNNDGYTDGYYIDDKSKNFVVVKGKSINEWPCTETLVLPIEIPYNLSSTPDGDPFPSNVRYSVLDLDNNGYLDVISKNGWALLMDKDYSYQKVYVGFFVTNLNEYTWLPLTRNAYPAGLLSNIKNEAPKAPQYVSAQQTEEGLLLKWADAEDDRTPAVQMRYNVSVKRKNKKVGEENAFLISPLNGLSDEAAICSNVAYRKATQMLIPKATLTNGETLEVQVQSIDLMGEHSPMTKPVEVTINNDGYIKVKDSHVTASLGTVVSFIGTKGTSYPIDGGEGATIKKDYGKGEYLVAWNTPGTKKVTITVDGKAYSTNIIAYDFADLALHFPAKVLRNTPITVKVPNGFSQYSPIDYGFKAADNYVVRYEKGDSTAIFTFKNSGEAKVCTFCKFDNSELSKENNVNVIDASMPAAKISEVIGDGANYRISWQPASNAEIAKVEISRETNRMNQYEVLATVDMNVGTYLDETSDNRIQAHRYRIRYIASNEVQKSAYSTPHNPLHVMINQCGNGYNLMWNAYEGMNVESYTILRGTSEDNMQPIEYVADSQQSYTDLTAKAGKYYYAVTFTPASSSTYAKSRAARTNNGIRSNVVSTEEALPTTLATSIAINCVESNNSLTNTQQTIHLYGIVLPTYSTYSRVSWSVVRNDDLASISNNGVLTAKGGRGLVTVRATTLDGSNLYVYYDVACNVDKEAAGIVIVEKDGVAADNKPTIYYDLEGRRIETPAKGHLYITNKGQKIML